MRQQLQRLLAPTRRRLRWRRVIWAAVLTALCAAVASLAAAVVYALGQSGVSRWYLMLPVVLSLPAALVAALWPLRWHAVARRVDLQFSLKDRVTSAWAFSAPGYPEHACARLQVLDTLRWLSASAPDRAISVTWPRVGWWIPAIWGAAALVSLMATVVTVPGTGNVTARNVMPIAERLALADELEDSLLAELEQLAELTSTPPPDQRRLQLAAQRVDEQLDQLRQPQLSRQDTLRTLSEIQAELSQASARFDPRQLAQQMDDLGQALASASDLQLVHETLQSGQVKQAAELLEQWQPEQLPELERKALSETLQPLTEDLQQQQSALADPVDSLQQSLEQDDAAGAAAAAGQLAAQLKQQAQRLAIHAALENQLAGMSDAKGQARSGGNNTAPSDESKQTWGRGKAGQPLRHRADEIATQRQREQLRGLQAQGPSERQQTTTDEATGQATRPLLPAERISRDAVEQVLHDEAIPLGHRPTIRRYFDGLRSAPATATADVKQPE